MMFCLLRTGYSSLVSDVHVRVSVRSDGGFLRLDGCSYRESLSVWFESISLLRSVEVVVSDWLIVNGAV